MSGHTVRGTTIRSSSRKSNAEAVGHPGLVAQIEFAVERCSELLDQTLRDRNAPTSEHARPALPIRARPQRSAITRCAGSGSHDLHGDGRARRVSRAPTPDGTHAAGSPGGPARSMPRRQAPGRSEANSASGRGTQLSLDLHGDHLDAARGETQSCSFSISKTSSGQKRSGRTEMSCPSLMKVGPRSSNASRASSAHARPTLVAEARPKRRAIDRAPARRERAGRV